MAQMLHISGRCAERRFQWVKNQGHTWNLKSSYGDFSCPYITQDDLAQMLPISIPFQVHRFQPCRVMVAHISSVPAGSNVCKTILYVPVVLCRFFQIIS